jgi:hypothetical protein
MGIQVQVAQTPSDEREVVSFLLEKWDLRCLPRAWRGQTPAPRQLGECDAGAQIFFPAELEAEVLRRVNPIVVKVGEFQVYPMAGVSIEWSRSGWLGPGKARAGRFYLDTAGGAPGDAPHLLKAVMDRLVRHIKRVSPLASDARFPVHVGADLARNIGLGTMQLVYPNGSVMPLKPLGAPH